MPPAANRPHVPVLTDLYQPALLPNPKIRIRVLLRRAYEHLAQVEQTIAQLDISANTAGVAQWRREHESFVFEKKWRLKVCLDHLEVFVNANPETGIRGDVEMLRLQWQSLNQVLGYMPSISTPCIALTSEHRCRRK